jgi:hypothetical protein
MKLLEENIWEIPQAIIDNDFLRLAFFKRETLKGMEGLFNLYE